MKLYNSNNIEENLSDYDEFASDDESSDSLSESDSDILHKVGHIPILMIPCDKFNNNIKKTKWSENDIFMDHFLKCEKCDKIDNNNINIINFLNQSKIHYDEISDEDDIDEYLYYYHNLKSYIFTLMNDDKKYDHIYIYKVNCKGHTYHKCILILY